MQPRGTPKQYQWIAAPLIIAVTVAAFFLIQNGLFRPHEQDNSAAGSLATKTPQGTAIVTPGSAPMTEPKAVADLWLASDKAKLSAPIRELFFGVDNQWDVSVLGLFAGHLEGTPKIGRGGNYVLAGHVELKDGTRGPFAELATLQVNDKLSIHNLNSQNPVVIQYRVTEIKHVAPDQIDVIRNHGYEELTLITCEDYDAVSNQYRGRLVIHARPTSSVPLLP